MNPMLENLEKPHPIIQNGHHFHPVNHPLRYPIPIPSPTPQQSHSPRRTRRPNQSQQRRLQTQKKRFIKKGMDLFVDQDDETESTRVIKNKE
jgi:hypothetical protein